MHLQDFAPANAKAFARFIYARVPGAAQIRFAIKDLAAEHIFKAEFAGVKRLGLGNGYIVDVGANRGQSIAAFRRLAPACKVIAFEPDPRSCVPLRARLVGTGGVVLLDCALGSEAGRLPFYLPRYGLWNCDGMSATTREDAIDWLRDHGRMFRFDAHRLSVEERWIERRTLDSFALTPALVKLHAQGAELDILRGAADTLRRASPDIMCAFPTPDVIDFLEALNYRPYRFLNGTFVPGQAGSRATFTWFLTDERASLLA